MSRPLLRPEHVPALESAPSFDDVYRAHAPFVFRVLRGMGVSDSFVDDALQDVFVVVHRRLATFDGRAKLRTWLFAIVYRVACDYRRKSRRTRRQTPLDDELVSPLRTPHQQLEGDQALAQLASALDKLDDEKRMIVLLADLEELPVSDIAQLTGVPLNTAYTRLRRARLALTEQLARCSKEAP